MPPATRSRGRGDRVSAPARTDAYVGMLVVAFLAQLVAALFLVLDYTSYPDKKPKQIPTRPQVTVQQTEPGKQ